MKYIVKVNDIQDVTRIRPLIAMDDNANLFTRGPVPKGFVDLGLPSGTLWSKSLLGATNGNTKESWYGNYYAWGEIETKDVYNWTNYKYANGAEDKLTKYCTNKNYGNNKFTDGLTKLLPEDDVATVTNSAWRMPTKAELDELIALQSQWVTNYKGIPDLNGRLFTGNNGNTLFIPATGYRSPYGIAGNGSHSYLWSSILDSGQTTNSYSLCSVSDEVFIGHQRRFYGCSVCPVC